MKNSKILKTIFTAFFLVALSSHSYGCTCIGGKRSIKEAFKYNNVVFLGEVISKEIITIPFVVSNVKLGEGDFYKYTFKVQRLYKGRIKEDTITIITGLGHGDCGYRFEIGKKYIVYAKWENKYFNSGEKVKKYLYTDICTRTTPEIEKEEEKIKKYRKPWRWKIIKSKKVAHQ